MAKYVLGLKGLLCVAAVAALMVTATGCPKKTESSVGKGGEKLTVTAPSNVDIKQGGTADVKVSIKREKFNEPVTVKFNDLPPGVTVETKDMTIAKDVDSGTFQLKASDTAELVTKEVTVSASGPGGVAHSDKFKLTVKEK